MKLILIIALPTLALSGCAANYRLADNGASSCQGVQMLPGSRLKSPCATWHDPLPMIDNTQGR